MLFRSEVRQPTTESATVAAEMALSGQKKEEIRYLRPHWIRTNPYQPRQHPTKEAKDKLEQLIKSVSMDGVLQPITVTEVEETVGGVRYELVFGEQRWRAAQKAGLEFIPAIVRKMTDAKKLEHAFLENELRSDLAPVDEIAVVRRLATEFNMKAAEIDTLAGKKRGWAQMRLDVSRRISEGGKDLEPLLELPKSITAVYWISTVVAQPLRRNLVARYKRERMSVEQIQKEIAEWKKEYEPAQPPKGYQTGDGYQAGYTASERPSSGNGMTVSRSTVVEETPAQLPTEAQQDNYAPEPQTAHSEPQTAQYDPVNDSLRLMVNEAERVATAFESISVTHDYRQEALKQLELLKAHIERIEIALNRAA